MTISEPKELISLLSQMEYWRQDPVQERQRAFRRFTVRGDATIEPVEQSNIERNCVKPVMLRDISRGGVGFVVEQFIDPGTVWRIAFYEHNHRMGSQVLIVRYCRLVQEGLYLVGAQFVIEPYLMVALGLNDQQLHEDIRDRTRPEDTAEFVAPDDMDSPSVNGH